MAISPYAYAAGSFNFDFARDLLGTTRSQLDDLGRQLSSGKVADTYGGLGVDRDRALDARSRIAAAEGFNAAIDLGSTKLRLSTDVLTRLSKNASDTRSDTLSSFTFDATGQTPAQKLGSLRFSEAVDLLNTQVNGAYLFSGRSTDVQPLVDANTILNGDGAGRAGVRTFIQDRYSADLGVTGYGRLLAPTSAGSVATLTEEAGLYGFKLTPPAGASAGGSSNPAILVALTAVPAPAASTVNVTFGANPAAGDTVTVNLTNPDKSVTAVTLTATTTVPAGSGQFLIGATPAATAANFAASLGTSIQDFAKTDLRAASSLQAANEFFAGSLSTPPLRVPAPTATATTQVVSTPATAVIWYQGDDDTVGAPNPRTTQALRVDEQQVVGIGVRANESPLKSALAQWAVLAVSSFSDSVPTDKGRYKALTDRVRANFGSSTGTLKIDDITTELSFNNKVIADAKARNTQRINIYTTVRDGVENAKTDEVAVALTTLQTRLQASYQVTGLLSKLSLTQYLR